MSSNVEISKNIRNQILEALFLVSSKEMVLSYQIKVPIADVSAEIFCLWEDSYDPNGDIFKMGFVKKELEALSKFNHAFEEVCRSSPDNLPLIDEVVQTSYWRKYSDAARAALKVFPREEVESISSSMMNNYS
jgi:hypothetical protein